PQNAAPAIQPTSVLLNANSRSKSPMMSPRIANDMAVATSAMQLARNSRRVVNVSAAGASDGPLMGMRTMPEILTESSLPFLLGTLANGHAIAIGRDPRRKNSRASANPSRLMHRPTA